MLDDFSLNISEKYCYITIKLFIIDEQPMSPQIAYLQINTSHMQQVILEDNGDVWIYNHLGWRLKKLLAACSPKNKQIAVVVDKIYLLRAECRVYIFESNGVFIHSYFSSHVQGHSWVVPF